MQQEGKDTHLKIWIAYIAFWIEWICSWGRRQTRSAYGAWLSCHQSPWPTWFIMYLKGCIVGTLDSDPIVTKPIRRWRQGCRSRHSSVNTAATFSFVTYGSEWMNDRASTSSHEVLLYRSVRNMFNGSWTVGCPCVSIHASLPWPTKCETRNAVWPALLLP
jgi:hypothetical protein